MIKRTIEISRQGARLTVEFGQLLIKHGDETVGRVPCEDIGIVLVDHPATMYSHAALTSLADSGAALIVCGRNHLPLAMLLPLSDHSQIVWRTAEQLGANRPLRKRLWKQIVQAKIRAQAANLARTCPARSKLLDLARQVRSGDPANVEAQAARIYWENWLPERGFHRDRNADGLNSLLNYGYAVLRAAVARALVAAGLLPSVGLHHANRANTFCLADDLMEPLRPMVDDRARELHQLGHDELTPETKSGLLRLLAEDVQTDSETGPLMVSLHRMAASLVRCYGGEDKLLLIPRVLRSLSDESGGPQPTPTPQVGGLQPATGEPDAEFRHAN